MNNISKSQKLSHVCYDIRGIVMERAKKMENEGQHIIKLNIGNLGLFGFDIPDEIVQDVMKNLAVAGAYTDSKGMFSARKAVMQEMQCKKVANVELDDIFLGNGASELISMSMTALLNDGDEVLVPAPDYPLWTASVSLAGGKPVHYVCDETCEWMPDLDDIRQKVTPRTKAIVVINPNNPTGALYSDDVLKGLIEIAYQHGLIIFADEIYDKILYDGAVHNSIASFTQDVLCLTFNGLSKNYRACGFRAGWMVISGPKHQAKDYIEGLNILASMRLCSNAPGQFAIQTALGGYQSIYDLTAKNGRLLEQRNLAYDMLTSIPGVSCVKPKAALYLFPKLCQKRYPIQDDRLFICSLLETQKVLLVQGSGFNLSTPDHFRLVFLPHKDILTEAIQRIERFLGGYSQ
jgi:alanine-synthesizing transaminase